MSPFKRAKKPRLLPTPEPHACALLAVDPAECSGYAIWLSGELLEYGECDVLDGSPQRLLERFLKNVPGPHVLVCERPFLVRYANQTSLGAADKIWRDLAKRVRLGRRTVRVYPATWRARVLGPGWARAPREQVRARELEVAEGLVRQHHPHHGAYTLPGHDAAAAILIGRWGSHAGEVAAVMPKRRAA